MNLTPEEIEDAITNGRVYTCPKHPEAGRMTSRESWEHNDTVHASEAV